MFESITADVMGLRKVCQTCGEITKPATVKRTAEAEWKRIYLGMGITDWGWWHIEGAPKFRTVWNKFEFIKFLEDWKR